MHSLVEMHHNKKRCRKVRTLVWNSPYGVCKFRKQVEEDNIKNYPKGTFFKIIKA